MTWMGGGAWLESFDLVWRGLGIWYHGDLWKKWLKEGIVYPILALRQTSLLPSDLDPIHGFGCSRTISKGEKFGSAPPALLCNHLFTLIWF